MTRSASCLAHTGYSVNPILVGLVCVVACDGGVPPNGVDDGPNTRETSGRTVEAQTPSANAPPDGGTGDSVGGQASPGARFAETTQDPLAQDPLLTAGSGAGSDGVAPGRDSLGATPLPCELRELLRIACHGCHAASPGYLAPMALTSREDLLAPAPSQPERSVYDLAPAPSQPERSVYDLARERVHSAQAPMPPTGRLGSEQLIVLDRFLQADLAAGPERCDGDAVAAAGQSGQETVDPDSLGRCYRFQAHAADSTEPYRVRNGESYACFFFDVPWEGEAQALTLRSLHTPITHHWLLSDTTESAADGEIVGDVTHCSFGAEKVLAVYGLNQQSELTMPEDVGLELPTRESGRGLLLGVHYVNPNEARDDTAGVEVCTAREPRAHTASVMGLGPQLFSLSPGQRSDVGSTCTPTFDGDIHILRSFPHMHERGVAIDTLIERAGGSTDTLLEVPYDFNSQLAYDTPAVLHPGDRLRTTCHFENNTDRVIFIGDSVDDEMCINFVTAWPAGALVTGRDIAGAEACLL